MMNKHIFILALTLVQCCGLGAQQMQWVPGAEVTTPGYEDGTDCAQNILCYALTYTPDTRGTLTSYTTNFMVDCDQGVSSILSNHSLVMTDNSNEILACEELGKLLLQSSGNTGDFLLKEAGRTYFLHEICVQTESSARDIKFTAEETGSLTTSLNVANGPAVTETPDFAPYVMKRNRRYCDELTGGVTVTEPELGGPVGHDGVSVELELSPNPAIDLLRVTVRLGEAQAELHILDNNGRSLRKWIAPTGSVETVSVAELPAGVYYLSAGPDYPGLTRKFVISR